MASHPAASAQPESFSSLRQQFLLRLDITFLNHGSFGACPRPVFERYQKWQRELEEQPVEFLGRRFAPMMLEARTTLADYVKCSPDELVFVPNATTGLNTVARSLTLQPGDEVLTTDHEYGALDRTWLSVCRARGASYVRRTIPLPVHTADEVVEWVWSGVTPRTRVLFLSHITSPTALVLPVAGLVRLAREAGITTVIDGAHAPGQIPLDLASLGADFYSGNCHKWLCAPKGSAFLFARRDVQGMIDPLVVSWGWNRDADTMRPSRFVDENEWQGTRDVAAYLTVPAAIQFQADHDWPRVRDRCHALLRDVRQRLSDLTGLTPPCPDSRDWYGQMASFPLPPCDATMLQEGLYRQYGVEVPVVEWQGRQLVRVSIQAYNSPADVQVLVKALASLLRDTTKGL
jgi:isopenicillin-N epimerase